MIRALPIENILPEGNLSSKKVDSAQKSKENASIFDEHLKAAKNAHLQQDTTQTKTAGTSEHKQQKEHKKAEKKDENKQPVLAPQAHQQAESTPHSKGKSGSEKSKGKKDAISEHTASKGASAKLKNLSASKAKTILSLDKGGIHTVNKHILTTDLHSLLVKKAISNTDGKPEKAEKKILQKDGKHIDHKKHTQGKTENAKKQTIAGKASEKTRVPDKDKKTEAEDPVRRAQNGKAKKAEDKQPARVTNVKTDKAPPEHSQSKATVGEPITRNKRQSTGSTNQTKQAIAIDSKNEPAKHEKKQPDVVIDSKQAESATQLDEMHKHSKNGKIQQKTADAHTATDKSATQKVNAEAVYAGSNTAQDEAQHKTADAPKEKRATQNQITKETVIPDKKNQSARLTKPTNKGQTATKNTLNKGVHSVDHNSKTNVKATETQAAEQIANTEPKATKHTSKIEELESKQSTLREKNHRQARNVQHMEPVSREADQKIRIGKQNDDDKPTSKNTSYQENRIVQQTAAPVRENHQQPPVHKIYPLDKIIENIDRIKEMKPPFNNTIVVKLHPPHIGVMEVRLRMDRQRNISALITSQDRDVVRLIGSHVEQMKNYLASQGVRVTHVDVQNSFQDSGNFYNQNPSNGSGFAGNSSNTQGSYTPFTEREELVEQNSSGATPRRAVSGLDITV